MRAEFTPTREIEQLKLFDGQNSSLNNVNAVNINEGSSFFDFSYAPQQDQSLTLKQPTNLILLGCENKDVGFLFNIYPTDSDGNIDLSSCLGLGYSPTDIRGGQKYMVRVKLVLDKPCLGVAFNFGILMTH